MALDVAAFAREPLVLLLGSTLLSSLIGSVHCAGMCGPLCLIASTSTAAGKPAELTIAGRGVTGVGSNGGEPTATCQIPAFAYHLGRLAIYSALGAIAGSLGAVVDLGSGLFGLQRAAALGAATFVISMGLMMLMRLAGFGLPRFAQSAASLPSRVFSAHLLARARRLPALYRAAVLGLLSGLLPCGWLYAFVLVAAGTASVGSGVLVMLAFWLGTVPLLVVLTVASQRLTGIGGPWLKLATACLLLIAGLGTIAHRSAGSFGADGGSKSAMPECCEPAAAAGAGAGSGASSSDLCTAQPLAALVSGQTASRAGAMALPIMQEARK